MCEVRVTEEEDEKELPATLEVREEEKAAPEPNQVDSDVTTTAPVATPEAVATANKVQGQAAAQQL